MVAILAMASMLSNVHALTAVTSSCLKPALSSCSARSSSSWTQLPAFSWSSKRLVVEQGIQRSAGRRGVAMAATGGASTSVQKSDEEWRAILSPEQFRILRKKGTE